MSHHMEVQDSNTGSFVSHQVRVHQPICRPQGSHVLTTRFGNVETRSQIRGNVTGAVNWNDDFRHLHNSHHHHNHLRGRLVAFIHAMVVKNLLVLLNWSLRTTFGKLCMSITAETVFYVFTETFSGTGTYPVPGPA